MDIFCFISEGLCTNEDGFVLFFILALAIYYVHEFFTTTSIILSLFEKNSHNALRQITGSGR